MSEKDNYVMRVTNALKGEPHLFAYSIVILLNEDNEVLMEERADDGFYDFPGGAIEIGESAEDAAARELEEETGLKAKSLSFFKLYSGPITYYRYPDGNEIYGVDAVYICKEYEGNIIEQKEEVKVARFYRIEDIPNKLSPRNKQIILDLQRYLKGE